MADASVMPDLVGGNIKPVVMMIGETAADMLRGSPPLAAAPASEKTALPAEELADVS